jgi:Zn-dependent protease
MTGIVWILLAIAAALVGLRAVQLVSVLVHMLRVPIRPVSLTGGEGEPDLDTCEAAAVTELEALGFHRIGWAWIESGPLRSRVLHFRHESMPAWAHLGLYAAPHAALPVGFYSFRADGRMLVTVNRDGVPASFYPGPEAERIDASADNLADHWQAHLARLRSENTASLDNAEAERHIDAWSQGYVDRLRDAGSITQVRGTWHLTLQAAARAARELLRARARMTRPYRSEALSGPCLSTLYARAYRQVEAQLQGRPSRHDVKVWVLALSVAVSLVLWGLFFGWLQAVAIVVIILVHESGHALAMRAFGYRDMSMFFLPMLGAIVTGSARDLATWKQALILLAGPLPGLFAGLAGLLYLSGHPGSGIGFDWQTAALMAVLINLFNLLPMTPLDGGQLMELALFSRWPLARIGFAGLSATGFIALAFWINSPVLWVLAVLLAWTMKSQWRVAGLQRAWREGLSEDEQIVHLFEVARQRLGTQPFVRHYGLVKGVFARRTTRRPRLWESAVVLILMVGLWSGVGAIVYQEWPRHASSDVAGAPLTAAQTAFDQTYDRYDVYEEEMPGAPTFEQLEQLARPLAADDPRRIDLAVVKARRLSWPEQREAFEAILAAHRDGYREKLTGLAEELLGDLYEENATQPPEQRAELLHAAVERVEKLAPGTFSGTIAARLREAEAIDEGGDPDRARAMLAALRERALASDDCRCQAREVVRAQAWFHIAHDQAARAVALLESSPYGEGIRRRSDSLSLDYAWALLEAGRTADGLDWMQAASYTKACRPSLLQRLWGARGRPARLRYPLDLAYALMQADRPTDAHRLMDNSNRWSCWRADDEVAETWLSQPWQETKDAELNKVAKAACP